MSSAFDPLHKLFNHPGLRRFLLALRIPIVLVFVALWPWWVQPELIIAGILVSLAGELLQVWCFACIEKEKVLTIRGPYQLCRNPMYLARYLLNSDVIVFPYRNIDASGALALAVQAGKPIVASATGVFAEPPAKDCLCLVPSEDAQALAQALLADPGTESLLGIY